MRVLLVEDEKETAHTIRDGLKDSYMVDLAFTGEDGEYQTQINEYDAIILDWVLPDISGLAVCKEIREDGIKTPILMLTGKGAVKNKVEALDAGADDYLTKPFSFEELLARLRALLRRDSETVSSNILTAANLTLDISKRKVERGRREISLRRKEFDLLEYLLRNRGRVLTRSMILEHVWGAYTDPLTNTVDVHIKYLRDHIDRSFAKNLIKTVHGLGYKIEG